MDGQLSVALVQPDLVWLKPEENLAHLSHLLSDLPPTVDLVVLPEMFTSGFTDNPEPLYGDQRAVKWMQDQAQQHQVAIAGSLACEAPEQYFADKPTGHEHSSPRYVNRLFFVTPDGFVSHYDKCHLFQMGGEHFRYQAGEERCVVNYRGWRLLLTICYDLRFPVFCRNQQDYDAMLCVANWPSVRRQPWRILLQARAIENQIYVVGVNRVGIDGKQLAYSGDSMAIDMQGNILVDGEDGKEAVFIAALSLSKLQQARESFPVWQDADDFTLK